MSYLNALDALRHGTAAFTEFQKANPGTTIDLSNIDFREAENANIRFSGVEFQLDIQFDGSTFGDTPIPHRVHGYPQGHGATKGSALFQNARFRKGASFRRVLFGSNARFDGCVFEEGVNFVEATFEEGAIFSRVVFESAGFGRCAFDRGARFEGTVFLKTAAFDEVAFGDQACFSDASFGQAHFQSSHFGENADFQYAVFSELAQFNNTQFGAGADFSGTSFCTRAGFEDAHFAACASFESGDTKTLEARARAAALEIAPEFRQVLVGRALRADPSIFTRASFSSAVFASRTHRYGTAYSVATGLLAKTTEGIREAWRLVRILFYPRSPLRKLGPAGVSFRGRQLKGSADFSCAHFAQPPDFQNVEPAADIDLAEATFSFASASWPHLRYWTTQTEALTRLRRLRSIAKDIDETDVESSLFALQRLAERGVSWRLWWDQVLRGWGIYDLIAENVQARQPGRSNSRLSFRLRRLVRSLLVALLGVGRPIMLTTLVTLYRYFSNFGRSVSLPILWLSVSALVPALYYSQYSRAQGGLGNFSESFTFSLCQLVIVSPVSKHSFETTAQSLFPAGLPSEVIRVALGQSVVGTILLFLIALALRNHFKVR